MRDELGRVLCCHGRIMACAQCGDDYERELAEGPSPDAGRMQQHAVEISLLLADAGIPACPLPEGVRLLVAQRDKWLDAFNRSEQFQNGTMKQRDLLRAALVGLVGVDGREQLGLMEIELRALPAPAADKAAAIDAAHALLAVPPPTQETNREQAGQPHERARSGLLRRR